MKPHEACAEWVRILRGVASGEIAPAEALARRPEVADDTSVPSAFWSARNLLEEEAEFGSEDPDQQAYFRGVMTKLAERIEGHKLGKP